MPKNRASTRDETDYSHFSPGATGLHHLHGHRSTLLSERNSAALALDLPPSRAGALRGSSSKVDSATRSQLLGMLSLLAVAALWGSCSPVLKFLFSQPDPPSAALMTAAQSLLAAVFLLAGSLGATSGSRREAKALGGGAATTASRPKTGALGPGLGSSLRLALAQMRSAVRSGATAWRELTGWGGSRRGELLLPARRTQISGGGAELLHPSAPLQPPDQPPQPPLSAGLGRLGPQAAGDLGDVLRDQDGGGLLGTGGAGMSEGVALKGSDSVSGPGRAGEGPPLGSVLSGATTLGSGTVQGPGPEGSGPNGAVRGWPSPHSHGPSHLRSSNLLAVPLGSLVAVGLELGTYNFCAAALGTWGLQRISATKVAFLGQATSLITPLLVALSGQRVALVVWGACCFGVLGATLVGLDGSTRAAVAAASGSGSATVGLGDATPPLLLAAADLALSASAGAVDSGGTTAGHAAAVAGVSRAMRLEAGADGTAAVLRAAAHPSLSWVRHGAGLAPALSQESMGANYVLASCVFYALGTVRLGVHSGRFAPLDLAAASALVYAALSVMWLLAEVVGTPTGGQSSIAVVARLLRDNAALALVLWAGLGPGALSSYLQVVGQRIVPAARAQMLYSSAPFWSALIARLLLGGRDGGMGPLAWLGGGVMLGASLLASLLDARPGAGSSSRAGPSAAVGPGTAVAPGHGGASGVGPVISPGRWSGGGAEGRHLREAERDL